MFDRIILVDGTKFFKVESTQSIFINLRKTLKIGYILNLKSNLGALCGSNFITLYNV